MTRRFTALRTFFGRAIRPADRARKVVGWLGFGSLVTATGVGGISGSWLLATVIILAAFAILLLFAGSTLVLESMPIDAPLEERTLALANEVRACDQREYNRYPYRFPSAYGIQQTVAEHLTGAFAHVPNGKRRRYTPELHRRVVAAINELALAGYKDDQLRAFLTRHPKDDEVARLALALSEQARQIYIVKHRIDYTL